MSFYAPSEQYSSKLIYKPHLQSAKIPLSPSASITTYFEKFEKNYQTISNNRNLGSFVSEIKGSLQQSRGKSLSTCYQPKRSQTYKIYGTDVKESQLNEKFQEKSADRYNCDRSIEKYAEKYLKESKGSEYISVEKLLQKDGSKKNDRKPIETTEDTILRTKSSKSCSTHQLASGKFIPQESFLSPSYKSMHRGKNQECPQSEKDKKFFNIYSQSKTLRSEKANKISLIMEKIEGIQKNFNDHLFYKSMDYTSRIVEKPESLQILKESKNSENTTTSLKVGDNIKPTTFKKSESYAEESRIQKARTFFEKENEGILDKSPLLGRTNEKIYSQIIAKRLDSGQEKKISKSVPLIPLMGADSPSQPCMTLDNVKTDRIKNSTNQSSYVFLNTPTKFDKSSLKAPKNPRLTTRQMPSNNITIEDFQIGKCLGKGRFGSVFLAKDKRSDALVALKVVKKKTIKDSKMANQIKNEIKIQSCLSHPNILKLYGFFQDEEQFYLILEYAPHGELYKKMKKQPYKRFDENVAAKYIRQVLEAVLYLHGINVIHRDIKPENILISFDLLKLSDFGWATYSPSCKRQTFCGTLDYVSPEIVGGSEYSEKVDVWSLGILCYELCAGKPPFEKPSNVETFNSILAGKYHCPEFFSEDIRDFLKKILIREQDKRPNLNELLDHPWIAKNTMERKDEKGLIYNKFKLL